MSNPDTVTLAVYADDTSDLCGYEWPANPKAKCAGNENHVCSIRMIADTIAPHSILSIHYCVCGSTHRQIDEPK